MNVRYINLPRQYHSLKTDLLKTIQEIMEQGDYILGKKLTEFETAFANYSHTTYALGVANGTDAIFLVLKALGIREGDEVITVPNSFIATAAAIQNNGARTVFVDVGDDFLINPDLIEQAITPKTKAILPVHLTGKPCDMDRILAIAKKHNLHIIEDAAQAAGATYKGKKVGSFGIAGCFSLHPLKTLNAYGDGGAITTDDKQLYEHLLILRNHGLKNRDECVTFAYNSRLDTLQAAIALLKLNHLDLWNSTCRKIAQKYHDNLHTIVKVPHELPDGEQIYHTFIIRTEKRDQLQAYLLQKGIETKIHYPIPIHLQEAARNLGYKKGDFPNTEQQAKTILSLPIYPELTEEEQDEVIREIKTFFHK